jgi:WhiB family redox-sensing transcriptional regulator
VSSTRTPITCACCNKPGRHAGRGLIVSCHSRHTKRGTLGQFPTTRDNPQWHADHRPPQPPLPAAPDGRWQEHAACRSADPEIFWPPANTEPVLERYLPEAKRVCNTCPVAAECLAYALATGQDDGIWAGTTPAERRQLQLRQAESATA